MDGGAPTEAVVRALSGVPSPGGSVIPSNGGFGNFRKPGTELSFDGSMSGVTSENST